MMPRERRWALPRRAAGAGFSLIAAVMLTTVTLAASPAAVPRVAAHRGGALLWPENSLTAFRNALALGADFLETDVHQTGDGEVVVVHDPTLERTSTGRGRVSERTRADLASVRLRTPDGAVTQDPLPTLAQLLDLLAPSRAELLLEIKVGADRRRYPGMEERVLALVRASGLAARTVIMAFEPETVQRVRALDPTIRTALLVSKGRVERERLPAREAVRWTKEVGASHLGIDHRVLDRDVVAAAAAAGVVVAAWTVNEETDMRRVLEAGAGIIISDRPDVALRVVGR